MYAYLTGVLSLFDHTLSALSGIPVFQFFLSVAVGAVALGVFLALRDATSGRRRRDA